MHKENLEKAGEEGARRAEEQKRSALLLYNQQGNRDRARERRQLYGQTAAPKMIGMTKKERKRARKERQQRERAAAAVAAAPLTVTAAAMDKGKDESKKNKGLALLQKMGWAPGQGIGADG